MVLQAIGELQHHLLRPGLAYKKAGVWLLDLARPAQLEVDLFDAPTVGNPRLMAAMDAINQRYGRGTIGLGATGWHQRGQRAQWAMRQEYLSKRYTTEWKELAQVWC